MGDEDTVPLRLLSRALDEVYALRQALAYEAGVLLVHTGYKSFPKSRRAIADAQAERMRLAARGNVENAYAGSGFQALRRALKDAGASETMTCAEWEAQRFPKRLWS